MELKGLLQFKGWHMPWQLKTSQEEIDLWPIVEKFFFSIHGKGASHELGDESYVLATCDSEFVFQYQPREYAWLKRKRGAEISDVHNFLCVTLNKLAGRMVEIEIDENQLEIRAKHPFFQKRRVPEQQIQLGVA